MMKIIVIIFLLISAPLCTAQEVTETLEDQLALDNPRVIKYLRGLTISDIGKKLKGIRLSDGSIALRNHIFLETIKSKKNNFSVYVFRNNEKKVAYAWVGSNGKPLSIPTCPADYEEDGQYVLSGDLYASEDVQPGDCVVILECVTKKWINEIKKTK